MSRSSDLGPLPLNWRDVGLSLAAIENSTVPLPNGTVLNRNRGRIGTESGGAPHAYAAATIEDSSMCVTIPAGRLLRSGQLCPHHDWSVLGCPQTVINLRHSDDASSSYHRSLTASPSADLGEVHNAGIPADESQTPIALHHAPAENSLEKYDTSNREVALWIASVLRLMQASEPPMLIHCRSGKDRTGVIVCAALLAVGVDPDRVRREYLLSSDTEERHIDLAITGLLGGEKTAGGVKKGSAQDRSPPWLRGVDVALLRSKLVGDSVSTQCSSNNVECSEMGPSYGQITADTVRQGELAFLRRRMQALQSVARPLLGQRIGAAGTYDKAVSCEGRSLLDAMICTSCRQVEVLMSMREEPSRKSKISTHSSCSENEEQKEDAVLNKRVAQAVARQAYLRKLDRDYVLARDLFECALWVSEQASSDCGASDKLHVRDWKRERAECLEYSGW